MHIIGLVGGVASGKSLVAEQLRQLGAAVLDGDRAGHEVLREPDVRAAIVERFGASVLDADGEVDRRAVGRIVFAPPPDGPPHLEWLEQLTHPRIIERLERQAEELTRSGTKAAVLDAPVMLKGGWHKMCNSILFIDAPRELRLERAKTRGWTEDDFVRREAAQEPIERKRAFAEAEIDNSGAPEATFEQIKQYWTTI